MLTENKKNYAGLITAELGKALSKPVLDMKGLSIKKTTVCKPLRKQFTNILQHDILEPTKIDLKNILNKYDTIGDDIENSLKNGEITYTLPKNVELFEGYKAPDTIEPVRAVLIWNALEPEQSIVPPEKINLIKLQANLLDNFAETFSQLSQIDAYSISLNSGMASNPNLSNAANLLIKNYPEKAKILAQVIFNIESKNQIDISRFGLASIALPKSVSKIPDYIRPFIDYEDMINQNITNGYILLKSLGIYVSDVGTTSYKSNIISI